AEHMPLTAIQVTKATKPGRYGDGHGLYLQITHGGGKSWLLRYERGGRERWMGLGPLHTVGLKDARERARKARQQLIDGVDPLEAKRAAKSAQALAAARLLTFQEAAEQYFNTHEKKWRNAKHRAQFISTLRMYAFPVLGPLSVASIDLPLVLKVLEPIWANKTETASRVRSRIEAVLEFATVRGFRAGENPARWRGRLEHVLPAPGRIAKPQHHPALPYAELPEFMQALRLREGVAARALEFLILTAARTGEVIGATWEEIDFNAKAWTVPAGRIKGGKEHRVPLSEATLGLLGSLPREDGNPFVFIGPPTTGLSNMAMASVLDRMGRPDITVHGFRSTFRDWAAEQTSFPNHVVEMALAHVIGNKVEAAYRRGDLFEKRRRLMIDWTRYCTTVLRTHGDVIPMKSSAA
ncbi:MAG TPA: integrase arm-type DNA-binding domain-containing protein, partial [Candidatus Saccharimonadales bacterium]|nr:integrase arm-type DNA-binding domain-containing protein [Candidatus Saccharimonadales bacterium]